MSAGAHVVLGSQEVAGALEASLEANDEYLEEARAGSCAHLSSGRPVLTDRLRKTQYIPIGSIVLKGSGVSRC